jgi:transposase
MAKKRKRNRGQRPGERKQPDSNQPISSSQSGPETPPEPGFFSPQTEQTEHDHTYKFPGVEKVAAHLLASFGNVLKAAEDLGISRTTLYTWIGQYPELEEARKAGNEARIDKAESKLMDLIEGVQVRTPKGRVYARPPSYQAIQFLLRTVGRSRGYVVHNQPIQSNTSAQMWDQLHELLEQARQEFGDDP